MALNYTCHNAAGTWSGNIRVLKTAGFIEAEINVLGNFFHILVGRHRYGNFLCIPNWGIGTELSELSDRFWNFERITTTYPELSAAHAASIVDALAALSLHYSI